MKTILPFFRSTPLLLALGLLVFSTTPLLQSCAAAPDPVGLQNATNLSTRLTTLMGKATEAFSKHSDDIKKVSADLLKAEEHAAAQKKNAEIASSWKILRTEQVEPFLLRWKEGKLDKDFVKEATAQVQKSLDAIKKAEQGKGK